MSESKRDMTKADANKRMSAGSAREANSTLVMALAGAAAGAFGVWALDRVDWFLWDHEDPKARTQTKAVRPGGEPPAQALVTRSEEATGTVLSPEAHETISQAVHYAIGIAPAVGYALLRDKLPGTGTARGALYGAGLFLMQDEVLNTVTGLGAKPQQYPWQAHARGLVAHTVYGIATELALNLISKAPNKSAATNN